MATINSFGFEVIIYLLSRFLIVTFRSNHIIQTFRATQCEYQDKDLDLTFARCIFLNGEPYTEHSEHSEHSDSKDTTNTTKIEHDNITK